MYVESTYGTLGSKAVLESPKINFTGKACLQFSAHMYGDNIGSLNVFLHNDEQQHKLYTIKGEQGDIWQDIKLNIEHSRWMIVGEISIIFEAVRGDGYMGDIAIDNIVITMDGCISGEI